MGNVAYKHDSEHMFTLSDMSDRNLLCCIHKKSQDVSKERDYFMGLYVREALRSTVCNAFLWKQKGMAPDQYPARPFMQTITERRQKQDLTEAEKQRAVDQFFAQEKARRVNWRRAHKD